MTERQRVLLAVSGGRDSVTLLDLMGRAGYRVGVAHCNFHLRPGDCDRDEAFVRQLSEDRGVPCYVAQFDTKEYASDNRLSVEEAARNLRYKFFDEVREREGYDLVATAHHRDDAIETFFINLLRGTGIGGLHGMPIRNGYIVRPLLCYGRDEIDAYVARHRLSYVEDITNSQTLYLRNKIRHELLPKFRELSPSFDSVMESNMRHLADADIIYRMAIDRIQRNMVTDNGNETVFDIEKLLGLKPIETVLFELLRLYGFNSSVVEQVVASLEAQSGKRFFSSSHRLIKDREKLVVTKLSDHHEESCTINEDDKSVLGGTLAMSVVAYDGAKPRLSRNEAWFDRDGLVFPLQLRRWREGDRFRPFGMKGTRLVSDLFSDLKLSLDEKERAWILCNGDGTIIWVVGYRASHYAVVGKSTSQIVKFEMRQPSICGNSH